MTNINSGVADGARRTGAKVRDLAIDGGLPGAPLGYRLRGATQAGPPQGGTWRQGDLVPDRAGLWWANTVAGWNVSGAPPARGTQIPNITLAQQIWMGSAGGPFATGGTTSASSNADTSTYAVGSQSYYVTTNGSGAQAKISGSFGSALNLTNECLVVWVRQDSLGNNLGGYPRLYLGDTSLTNAYFWKLTSASGQPWNLDGEWLRVTLPFGTATTVGSPSRSSLAAMTIQVFDNSAGTTTLHFGGIATMPEPPAFPNGAVSLCFDDGYVSQVNTAAPLMDGYGYRGTAFLIAQVAMGGGASPYTSYMTVAQAQILEAINGWECATHAYSAAVHNAGYAVAGDVTALADAAAAKAFMTAEGFKSPWLHAYPLGTFDAGTILNSRELFGAARTISSCGGFPDETFPPANLTRLRSLPVSTATSLATVEAYVTAAQANKEWLILTFHDIEASASGNLQFSTANFTSLLAFISAAGIPVLPIGDVLAAGLSGSPVAALGDTVYGNAAAVAARLPGNTTATKNFLTQTGTGSASAAPTWGTISAADVPTLNQNTTGTAGGLSATLAIGSGGTGQTTQQAAMDTLAGAQTSGDYLRGNGSHVVMAAIAAADLPTGTTSAQGALQLDGTASDIQPIGTAAAAGTSGLAADAKHVHADQGVGAMPADMGLIAWNMDFALVSATNNITPGTVYLHAIWLRSAQTVTNLIWDLGTVTAWTCTANECFMALFDSGGTQRGITADQSSAWNSAGLKTAALTSAYAAAAGKYYIGILMNGSGTTFTARGGSGVPTFANAGLSGASLRFAVNGTVQTVMPSPITPSNNTNTGALPTAVGIS